MAWCGQGGFSQRGGEALPVKKEQNLWTEGCLLSMETSGRMTGVQRKFILSAQFWGSLYYMPGFLLLPFFKIFTLTL